MITVLPVIYKRTIFSMYSCSSLLIQSFGDENKRRLLMLDMPVVCKFLYSYPYA